MRTTSPSGSIVRIAVPPARSSRRTRVTAVPPPGRARSGSLGPGADAIHDLLERCVSRDLVFVRGLRVLVDDLLERVRGVLRALRREEVDGLARDEADRRVVDRAEAVDDL